MTSASNQQTRPSVRVWDRLVRIFHWSLASFFAIAWLSAEDIQSIHELAGYTIGGLILFRLVWGVIGSRHARFRDFVTRPTTLLHYLRALPGADNRRYLGHNPAGAAMVIGLLLSLTATVLCGVIMIGAEGEGPLAYSTITLWAPEFIEEAHEVFANLSITLVGLHLLGVLFSSLHHRENLVRAMVTGMKERRPDDIDHSSSSIKGEMQP